MSLQRRLVAVMSVLMVAGLLVADVVTYASVRSFLYGRADDTLSSSETLAFNYVLFTTERRGTLSAANLSRHVSPDVYVLITNEQGQVIMRRPSGSPTRPNPMPLISASVPIQRVPEVDSKNFGRFAGTFRPDPNAVVVGSKGDPDGSYRTVAVAVPQGTMYVALSLNPTNDTLTSLRNIELVASIAVLLIMGTLVWWLVRRDLRPLRQMAVTADAIASGDLGRRVPQEAADTEVGRLGTALNEMLTQIEGAFAEKSASEDRLRQFVADASHELRTPLTSIRGYAELLRRGGFSDEAGTRRALQRVEEEATRMGGLVEDLLLLAELDRGRPLRTEPVGLRRLCADVLADSVAVDHGHHLVLADGDEVTVRGDPERLAQVAHNMVRNALAHTKPGTTVEVSVYRDGTKGVLQVSDDGPGIDQDQLTRVFDRFYRGDPARTGAGTGLGLAIVRAIAQALGGWAEISSPPGGGVRVSVRIPLADGRSATGVAGPAHADTVAAGRSGADRIGQTS